MTLFFSVSDMHGRKDRYAKLFTAIEDQIPEAVFLGGDILPSGMSALRSLDIAHADFINDYLAKEFGKLRDRMGAGYPNIFVILGNDDYRIEEAAVMDVASQGIWTYAHDRRLEFGKYTVFGYACVPPTPFMLKDWERYDVSRYVDPGCISPEDGVRSVPVNPDEIKYATIRNDLDQLTGNLPMDHAICLFHCPPHDTLLDRAALDGRTIDFVPVDVHIGSIAIQRFIKTRQPLISLHGHVHESTQLTGSWVDRIGRTYCFNPAHNGRELAIIRFDPEYPESADRILL
jgi:uncharacterized protein